MSSLSVRFLTPPLPCHSSSSSTASPHRPRSVRLRATPAAAPSAPSAAGEQPTAVDAARLEPRVEERGGYWVLKEKFREGINPQEKVKLEREPMKLFMENGIEELAKLSMEEIDKAKVTKDDVDVRLKWLGLFHRRKHQCECILQLYALFDHMQKHMMNGC